jgi:hypothetical protein
MWTAWSREVSGAAAAPAAGLDRLFLYRHHDLRAEIHTRTAQSQPDTSLPRSAR